MKDVLVGGEPVFCGTFCFCCFLHCLSHIFGGVTTSLGVSILPQARAILFLPVFGLPLLFVLFFRGTYMFSFFLFISLMSLILSFLFVSFNVPGLLKCVCCARRIQYDGMALHCLPPLLHYDVVSLCGSFVTTELVLVPGISHLL